MHRNHEDIFKPATKEQIARRPHPTTEEALSGIRLPVIPFLIPSLIRDNIPTITDAMIRESFSHIEQQILLALGVDASMIPDPSGITMGEANEDKDT